MMACARTRFKRGQDDVCFLSARHWSLWPVTYLYLIRNLGFFFRPTRLILVSDPEQKIQIIERKLVAGNGLLVVIDDLSYNTENGNTQFYDDVIRYLHSRKHRLRHIGKEKIDKINRNFSASD